MLYDILWVGKTIKNWVGFINLVEKCLSEIKELNFEQNLNETYETGDTVMCFSYKNSGTGVREK